MKQFLNERLTWYRLRDPARHDSIYGDQIEDKQRAFRCAATLAGFYQHPIEVYRVIGGKLVRPVGTQVEPGPTAPAG